MGQHGGKRPGSGRKPIHDEIAARDISTKAITEVYGSLKDGFIALLNSKESSLIRFVFEHAVGKPKETVELSGKDGGPIEAIIEL
jgi:phosphoheptose isomerase